MQGYRCCWSGGSAGDYVELIRPIRAVIRSELDVEAEGTSSRKSGGKLTLAVNVKRGI
jgi:hypothetical protein